MPVSKRQDRLRRLRDKAVVEMRKGWVLVELRHMVGDGYRPCNMCGDRATTIVDIVAAAVEAPPGSLQAAAIRQAQREFERTIFMCDACVAEMNDEGIHEEEAKDMASTGYLFNTTTKRTLQQAKDDGWTVEMIDERDDRLTVRLKHPRCPSAPKFITRSHGEVNNKMVKFLARQTKLIRDAEKAEQDRIAAEQAEREARESRKPIDTPAVSVDANPDYKPPKTEDDMPRKRKQTFDERVRHAAETLVVWLDEQYAAGLRQFPVSMLNAQVRERIGLPVGEPKVIEAALGRLVARNILSQGKLTAPNSGRRTRAYRMEFDGATAIEVWTDDVEKAAPPAPSDDDPKEVTVTVSKKAPPAQVPPPPAPVVSPSSPSPDGLDLVLGIAVDTLVREGRYDELATVVKQQENGKAGAILRRVAELAKGGAS